MENKKHTYDLEDRTAFTKYLLLRKRYVRQSTGCV